MFDSQHTHQSSQKSSMVSYDESGTMRLAQRLAAQVKEPLVITLSGALGSGKSVFARGLIRALMKNAELDVPSPTFTLLQSYDASGFEIHHLDLYRLKNPEEVLELGWEELVQTGLVIVEWPERLGHFLPKWRLDISFEMQPNHNEIRTLTITAQGVQMPCLPDQAFVLAAGFGSRLRPLTDHTPKPLAEVAGRSLLARTLDALADAGVNEVVINTHHLAPRIEEAVRAYAPPPKLILSHEPELLDTGGGILKALHQFKKDGPFFVLSGDGLWREGQELKALERLAAAWDQSKMDILMLLHPRARMQITEGTGDYHLHEDGRALRAKDRSGPYVFTSIRLNHPRIFEGAPAGPFSYLELLDRAESHGRLYGIIHDGDWYHISRMEDLAAVNALYSQKNSP